MHTRQSGRQFTFWLPFTPARRRPSTAVVLAQSRGRHGCMNEVSLVGAATWRGLNINKNHRGNESEGYNKIWHQKRVFENFLIVVSYPVNVSSIQVKIVKYCIFTIKTTHKFPEIELQSTTLISFSILIEIGLTRCADQFPSTAYPRIAIANPTPTSCCNLRESKLSNNLKYNFRHK